MILHVSTVTVIAFFVTITIYRSATLGRVMQVSENIFMLFC